MCLAFHDFPQPPSAVGINTCARLAWQLQSKAIAMGENREEKGNIIRQEGRVKLFHWLSGQMLHSDVLGRICIISFCQVMFVIYKSTRSVISPTAQHHNRISWGLIGLLINTSDSTISLPATEVKCRRGGGEWVQERRGKSERGEWEWEGREGGEA